MPSLATKQTFMLQLSPNELRLIMKALGCRLEEDEKLEAAEILKSIQEQKIAAVKHSHHEAEKLLANIAKAESKLAEPDSTDCKNNE